VSQCKSALLGAFALALARSGASCANGLSSGAARLAGLALISWLIVTIIVYAVGYVLGGHLSPVRPLAPASASGHPDQARIFPTAPFVGAVLAVLSRRLLRDGGCCLAVGEAGCSEET
jgi:glycerol uptake facilitator-like aquaporin